MNQEIKHVRLPILVQGTFYTDRPLKAHKFILTIKSFAGTLYATLTSEYYVPAGYPESGTFKYHLQNHPIKQVPKDFDKFIDVNINHSLLKR